MKQCLNTFSLLLFLTAAIAVEPPTLQKNDYPVIVSIRSTDATGDQFTLLPSLAARITPLLKDYGYAVSKHTDYGKFFETFLSTDDARFPKYICLRKRDEDGVVHIEVSTRGDLTADGYSGHSDDFTFWVVTQIKPLINTRR